VIFNVKKKKNAYAGVGSTTGREPFGSIKGGKEGALHGKGGAAQVVNRYRGTERGIAIRRSPH